MDFLTLKEYTYGELKTLTYLDMQESKGEEAIVEASVKSRLIYVDAMIVQPDFIFNPDTLGFFRSSAKAECSMILNAPPTREEVGIPMWGNYVPSAAYYIIDKTKEVSREVTFRVPEFFDVLGDGKEKPYFWGELKMPINIL